MLLYRISMKLRRHLFAACLLLCATIFVLSYVGLHNGHSTTLKPVRQKMEWINQRLFSKGVNLMSQSHNTTSADNHSTSADNYAFNNPRKLHELNGKEKPTANNQNSKPIASHDKEETKSGFSDELEPDAKMQLMLGVNRTDSVNRNRDITHIGLSDTELITPSSKFATGPGGRIPLKTKQLQGSIKRQHELFVQAYKDLLYRNELLERGKSQKTKIRPHGRKGNRSLTNTAQGQLERDSSHLDEQAKNQTDILHKGSKQGSLLNMTNNTGGGKSEDVDSVGDRLRVGSIKSGKRKQREGHINGLQGDAKINDRGRLMDDPTHMRNVGSEGKEKVHSTQNGQSDSFAIKNVQILPSNATSGKLSFTDKQKTSDSLVSQNMWSLQEDIGSYKHLVKKVVRENGRKASILDKYMFPVKHANSEDNTRIMGKYDRQKYRFHDGLQNFEPDHHVFQVDRPRKELPYKFQSDTVNRGDHVEDSENTRPETCKGCLNLDFKYLVNGSTICQKTRNGLDLLILLASDPVNELARTAIRKTWGRICRRRDSNIACVFMIANTPKVQVNQQVYKESLQHKDIVIFSFMDAYTNLTLKSLMGLQWSQQFCPQAKYVMKTDEDVYVNTLQLPIMLQAAPTKGFFGGFCWGLSRPSRDPENKWSVTYEQYPKEFLPPMCSGTGYLISRDLVISILKVSPNIPYFYLEDVYIAFCVQNLGVLPVNIQGFSNMRTDFQSCEYKYYVLTSHQISEMEMIDFWEEIQMCPDHPFTPHELYNPLPLPDLT